MANNILEQANEKIDAELQKVKDKNFADPILGYIKKRCEEDSGLCEDVCQEHKTWCKCFDYIYRKAREYAKGKRQCAVRYDLVYEWAEDYYRKDDKAEEEEKARKEAERKQKEKERKEKEAKKKVSKPVQKVAEKKAVEKKTVKDDLEGQMDIFSFMGM